MIQSLIAWLNEHSWHHLSTKDQPWTAPVSVLGHSWPTFPLFLYQFNLPSSLCHEQNFFISPSVQNAKGVSIISEWSSYATSSVETRKKGLPPTSAILVAPPRPASEIGIKIGIICLEKKYVCIQKIIMENLSQPFCTAPTRDPDIRQFPQTRPWNSLPMRSGKLK